MSQLAAFAIVYRGSYRLCSPFPSIQPSDESNAPRALLYVPPQNASSDSTGLYEREDLNVQQIQVQLTRGFLEWAISPLMAQDELHQGDGFGKERQ